MNFPLNSAFFFFFLSTQSAFITLATVTQAFMHGCKEPISRDTALEEQQVHQETVTSLLGVVTDTKG